MLYRLSAPVEGLLFIKPPRHRIAAERDNLQFELGADATGRVVRASVTAKVPAEKVQAFRSSIGPGHGGTVATVVIGGDPQLHDFLVRHLQVLECNLSFALLGHPVRRVIWRECEHEVIPETDEERALVAVTAWNLEKKYPEVPGFITEQGLQGIVAEAPLYDEFVIVRGFWHEGMNCLRQFQYVQAFYQFYFVIEGFYADGKTGEKAVLKAFRASDELTDVLRAALRALTKDEDRHAANLRRLMAAEGCEVSADGLRQFLFRVRGHLHHYSSKSRKPQVHPFNQRDFETVALLGMYIARVAINRRIACLNERLGCAVG